MKEFIEKLIGALEEVSIPIYDSDTETENKVVFADVAKNIVNQLAEEYINCSTDTSSGWIPCSERLPELTEGTECFKQSPCCLTTLKWWDGDMTESIGWYNQSGVWNEDSKNCKVIAWQPLPEPYQPKGE